MPNITRRQLLAQTRNLAIVSAAFASYPAAAKTLQNNPGAQTSFGYGEGVYGEGTYPAEVDPIRSLFLPIVTKE